MRAFERDKNSAKKQTKKNKMAKAEPVMKVAYYNKDWNYMKNAAKEVQKEVADRYPALKVEMQSLETR